MVNISLMYTHTYILTLTFLGLAVAEVSDGLLNTFFTLFKKSKLPILAYTKTEKEVIMLLCAMYVVQATLKIVLLRVSLTQANEL